MIKEFNPAYSTGKQMTTSNTSNAFMTNQKQFNFSANSQISESENVIETAKTFKKVNDLLEQSKYINANRDIVFGK